MMFYILMLALGLYFAYSVRDAVLTVQRRREEALAEAQKTEKPDARGEEFGKKLSA